MPEYNVFRTLKEATEALDAPVVTIGNFDGVHLGHQAIFERVGQLADARGSKAVALTFSPHPVRYFRSDAPAFRLTTDRQKLDMLDQFGLDATVLLDFDADIAALTPDQFVDTIVDAGLGATCVVVGSDFRFGKARAGDTDDLERLCRERGIGTEITTHVELDDEPISSTRVRRELAQGHMEEIVRLLGRPYRIEGEIVEGDKRGRKLGFPTANIATTNPLLPPNGVYATSLYADSLPSLHSITNVGTRPTFDGDHVTVECFVLSHDADELDLDLYGKQVELDFWKFVRAEKKFDSPEELVAQIKKDVSSVRSFFTI